MAIQRHLVRPSAIVVPRLFAVLLLSVAGRAKAETLEPPSAIPVTSRSHEAVVLLKQARLRLENGRWATARQQLRQALALDPGFALAHAYLGSILAGPEGLRHLERAVRLGQRVPEIEATWINMMLSDRLGRVHATIELFKRLVVLAPQDWRVHNRYGRYLMLQYRYAESLPELDAAIALNPTASEPYNSIAYALSGLGRHDEAIRAAQRQIALNPDQPNPVDSLAEIQLMAGAFADAEATFNRVVAMDPVFDRIWNGVAVVRYLRGDRAGAYEALDRWQRVEDTSEPSLEPGEWRVLMHLADGDHERAHAVLDGLVRLASAQGHRHMLAAYAERRALLFADAGRWREARAALPRRDRGAADLALELWIGLRAGRPRAELLRTLSKLQAAARAHPDDRALTSALHFGRGVQTWAVGDLRGAVTELSRCFPEDLLCRLHLVEAHRASGDDRAAEATRRELVGASQRDPLYLYVRRKAER